MVVIELNIKVFPQTLAGTVMIPASKSLTHRALICASLAQGTSYIHNPLFCDDTEATIDCLRHLGVEISVQNNVIQVTGVKKYHINGTLNAKDSATTLRLLLPLVTLEHRTFSFYGSKRLMKRMQNQDFCDLVGLTVSIHEDHLTISGQLQAIDYHLSDVTTSQIISGMFLALPYFKGKIHLQREVNPYVVMTMEMMKTFGIILDYANQNFFQLSGQYTLSTISIESDFSSAAFFIAMMVYNQNVRIEGLNFNSFQGDIALIEYLKKMGAEFIISDGIMRCIGSDLRGDHFNLNLTPDLVPVLASIACVSQGTTRIQGISRLHFKESDRIEAICHGLTRLGAHISCEDDTLIIDGQPTLEGGCDVFGFDDHRIIMSLIAISSRVQKPYTILGVESIRKSFPTFLALFESIGGRYER